MVFIEALTNQILFGKTKHITSSYPKNEDRDLVASIGKPTYFCVGIVDIVNSTQIVCRLSPLQSSKYYITFLNHMAKIVNRFNGQILKTMGDSLLFYFPETSHSDRKSGFLSCLECGFSMINSHEKLKTILAQERLPIIDFRVSFDYGVVTMMGKINGPIDIVGPTINTCSKINGLCPVNGMVVGNDLYEKTRNFKEYKFRNNGSFKIDPKHPYPIFRVSRN